MYEAANAQFVSFIFLRNVTLIGMAPQSDLLRHTLAYCMCQHILLYYLNAK